MRDALRRCRPGLAAAGIVALVGSSVGAQTPGFTIRRADIESAGWNRVAELLEAAVGFSRASVDGFTLAVAGDHLPAAAITAPGAPDVVVLVDGHRMFPTLVGQSLLELLPIAPQQIESVTVVRGPTVIDGIVAVRGAIRFFRRSPPRGLSGAAARQSGDESGDPGPFRYTPLTSPNTEHIGPFTQFQTAWSNRRVEAAVAYHAAAFTHSDTIITSRLPANALTADHQYDSTSVVSGRVALRAIGTHELLVGRAHQGGLLFVPVFGQEQPVEITRSSASISGAVVGPGGTSIRYSLGASRTDVGTYESSLPFTIGHRRSSADARTEIAGRIGEAAVRLDGSIVRFWLDRADSASGDARLAGRVAVGASWRGGAATAGVTHSSTRSGPDVSLGLTARSRTGISTSVTATFAVPVAESCDGWIDRAVLWPLLPHASGSPPTESPRTAVGAIALDARRGGHLRWSVGTGVTRVDRWEILPPAGSAPSGALAPASATTLDARMSLATGDSGLVVGNLDYDAWIPLSAADAMRDALRANPAHDARASLRVTPFRDTRFTGSIWLRSSSDWRAAWSAVARSAAVATVGPPEMRVDVSGEKWVWSRRLRLQALVRNALERPDRMHPLGAQWNLRTYLSGSLALPGA